MTDRRVSVQASRCIGCALCVNACPEHAISMQNGIAFIDPSMCSGCLACVGVCRQGAIIVTEMLPILPAQEREIQARQPTAVQAGGERPLSSPSRTAMAAVGTLASTFVLNHLVPRIIGYLTQRPSSAIQRSNTGTIHSAPLREEQKRGRQRRWRRGKRV